MNAKEWLQENTELVGPLLDKYSQYMEEYHQHRLSETPDISEEEIEEAALQITGYDEERYKDFKEGVDWALSKARNETPPKDGVSDMLENFFVWLHHNRGNFTEEAEPQHFVETYLRQLNN